MVPFFRADLGFLLRARIRREVIKCRYLQGKRVYKYDRLVLTVQSRFKELVELFVGRDLKVEASHEGSSMIKVKPIESAHGKNEYLTSLV